MLTGTLQEAGVFLGNVYDTSIPFNRKGLQEPKAVLYMQENLLNANGGSWSNPPPTLDWQDLHLAVRDLFIESRAGRPIWGFKDPRTLFTLEGWQSVLPSLECVGIFRHPLAVATSLHGRNGFPLEKGLDLWRIYNERLLLLHGKSAFPIMEFHRSSARLRTTLSTLLEVLHLSRPLQPSEFTFFDESLRQHDTIDMSLPAAVENVYHRLLEVAL